uniref:Pre-mRNA-splicing factor SYF1 n=1 Tax=Ananas comosus var. bracteatus TaxID=296719 RepID=A0A6V7PA92_ANACO|nr:unnamed protein product [Ananas comosus var. bracteatus]
MHRMPRIWLMYLASLTAQRRVTRARRTFDRALRSLPVSQHARVWPLYLRLVSLPGVPLETAVRVHRRYLIFDPSHLEDYIELLLRSSRWQEAKYRYPSESDDFPYEEEVLREPLKLQAWRRYLAALAGAPPQKRFSIYERALRALPGSYKLWRGYLVELLDAARPSPSPTLLRRAQRRLRARPRHDAPDAPHLAHVPRLPHRAAPRHPREPHLRPRPPLPPRLPARRVWPSTSASSPSPASPSRPPSASTAVTSSSTPPTSRITSNCSSAPPAGRRPYLASPPPSTTTTSPSAPSRARPPPALARPLRHCRQPCRRNLNYRPERRSCHPQRHPPIPDEKGLLWTSLADYYARRGLFAKARDVFEDGLNAVSTARDFGLIFEAYAQFEQLLLAAKLDASDGEVDNGNLNDGEFWLNGGDDTDFLIARIELLFDRRPKLLNCVLLRQNPHNVEQWRRLKLKISLKELLQHFLEDFLYIGNNLTKGFNCRRAKLFDGDPSTQVSTYVRALKTVDPMKAVGKPYTLWVDFARMYESRNLLDSAEEVFERATQVNFKLIDHLATVWCEWAEMELRHNNFEKALQLMRQATAEPSVEVKKRAASDGNEPVQMKLHKSLRVWSAYVDLEESLGSVESTRDVYDRILDLKIATPQIILNYASFLETPSQEVKPLYLQYAKMEEDYGLLRRALHVYERAVKAVPDCEKSSVYESYINQAESLGFKEVRKIYEQAIEAGLPDSDLKSLCMRLADREASLGEIARARRLYTYASEYADLQSDSNFWKKWREFEIMHGNDDTFREMLRIKRTVSLHAQTFERIRRQRLQ